MRIRCSIDISRDSEIVFPWIADPEKALQWQTSVEGGRIIQKTRAMVGTTFEETIRDERGSTTLHGIISSWIPNELVAFKLEGKYNSVEVEFQLESENGHTRVTQKAEVHFKSMARLVIVFLGPVFRKKITKQIGDELRRLKELCEGTPGAHALHTERIQKVKNA